MRTTIIDIARLAGVSAATVDRALNGRAGVHARTRRRVLTAARSIGYIDAAPDAPQHLPGAVLDLAFIIPGGTNTFLDALTGHLQDAAAQRAAEARIHIHRPAAFQAANLAANLRELAAVADGIGLVAIDHPAVRTAIRDAAAAGARVATLVSDISDVPRDFYVGIDNQAAGRLAGHLLGRFLRDRSAKVAMFAGSLSYRGHEARAVGFRRILAEEFPDIVLVETAEMHDDLEQCYRAARHLLQAHPDLAGIYNIGAGNRGIVRALDEAGRSAELVFIGHELTEHTRRFLLAGSMSAVIDQDPRAEADLAVDNLIQAVRTGDPARRVPPVRAQAIFRENLPEP